MKQTFFAKTILILWTNKIEATAINLKIWNNLNLKYNPSDKHVFFKEAKLSSLKFYSDFDYFEHKGMFKSNV